MSHFEGGLICSIIGSKCVHKDSHINKSNYIITAFPIQLVFNSYSQAGGPFSTCVFSPPTLRAGRLLLLHGKTGGNFASLFVSPVSTVVVVTLYYGGFSYCISITERVNSSGNTKKSLWKGAKWGRKARVACFMNLMLLSKVSTDGISKWSSIRAIKGQIVNTKDHTYTSLPVKTVFCTLAINSTCNFFVK